MLPTDALNNQDFSASSANRFWLEKDPRLLHILMAMERAESWVVDGNEKAEKALQDFFTKAQVSDRTQQIGRMSDVLIYVMANLGVTRAMYMLSWLDSIAFGLGSKVVQSARRKIDEDQTEFSKLILERLSVLKRTRVLSRVFSTSRMMMVLRSLENYDEA